MSKLYNYTNGNAIIELFDDGTRIVTFNDILSLEYPLNIDIKVSSKCNMKCNYCHESNNICGYECDYEYLKEKLTDLPKGIELAIGCNELTDSLYDFIIWCNEEGYVVNLTVNQGHIERDFDVIKHCVESGHIKGLGFSYRSSLPWNVPKEILEYPNTIFHVIVGIDDFNDVLSLKDKGVKKLLCLGEKNFGFNKGKVDLASVKHRQWYWWVKKLFDVFDTVSFDNLALEQLNLKRFLTNEQWEEFYQGEYSFYVNAVEQYFAPSSRSDEKISWNNITIKEYFKSLNK